MCLCVSKRGKEIFFPLPGCLLSGQRGPRGMNLTGVKEVLSCKRVSFSSDIGGWALTTTRGCAAVCGCVGGEGWGVVTVPFPQ